MSVSAGRLARPSSGQKTLGLRELFTSYLLPKERSSLVLVRGVSRGIARGESRAGDRQAAQRTERAASGHARQPNSRLSCRCRQRGGAILEAIECSLGVSVYTRQR